MLKTSKEETLFTVATIATQLLIDLNDTGVLDSPKGPRAKQAVKNVKQYLVGKNPKIVLVQE